MSHENSWFDLIKPLCDSETALTRNLEKRETVHSQLWICSPPFQRYNAQYSSFTRIFVKCFRTLVFGLNVASKKSVIGGQISLDLIPIHAFTFIDFRQKHLNSSWLELKTDPERTRRPCWVSESWWPGGLYSSPWLRYSFVFLFLLSLSRCIRTTTQRLSFLLTFLWWWMLWIETWLWMHHGSGAGQSVLILFLGSLWFHIFFWNSKEGWRADAVN